MNVVPTAPSPGMRTPSLPLGSSILTPFCTTLPPLKNRSIIRDFGMRISEFGFELPKSDIRNPHSEIPSAIPRSERHRHVQSNWLVDSPGSSAQSLRV